MQSCVREDIDYWIQNAPAFGKQVVYLIPAYKREQSEADERAQRKR